MIEATLVEMLRELDVAGYPSRLASGPGGVVRCSDGTETKAEDWTIERVLRLEGESDPDEEVIVLGVRGPERPCGPRGALVLGYGPNASAEDRLVLAKLVTPRGASRGIM